MKWKNDTKDFSLEAGAYDAVFCSLIDIGTQHGEYNGKPKVRRQAIIGFELPGELYTDEATGKESPSHISEFYTQSLDSRAKLRKHLKGARGRDFTPEELEGFDPKSILGASCILAVSVKENGKNEIDTIMKARQKFTLHGEPRYFMMTDDDDNITFDGTFPIWMSEGIQNLIKKSDEYRIAVGEIPDNRNQEPEKAIAVDKDVASLEDDDIPF